MDKLKEAGFLDGVKSKLGLGQTKPTTQQSQEPTPKNNAPDVARSTEQSEQEDPLSHVVSSIVRPVTHGQVRVIVNLDRAELTSYYLKTGPESQTSHKQLANILLGVKEGAQRFNLLSLIEADEVTDPVAAARAAAEAKAKEKLSSINKTNAKSLSAPRVVAMKPGYKFSDMVKGGKNQDSVLLDVPVKVYDSFKNATSPLNKAAALASMFDHRYYVMTLNTPRARELASHVDSAGADLDKEKVAINPEIIVNHPRKQTIKLAKGEWNEKYATKHAKLLNPSAPQQDNIKDAEDKLAKSATDTKAQQSTQSPETQGGTAETPAIHNPPPQAAEEATKALTDIWHKFTNGGTVSNKDMTPEMKELISKMYRTAHPGSWQEYMSLKKPTPKKKGVKKTAQVG